jgi:hypothetical protein
MLPLRRIAADALPFAMRACYRPAQDPQQAMALSATSLSWV